MQLKQYLRYQIDFTGKWVQPSALLMGLAFFLRLVYYLCLVSLHDCGIGEIIFSMLLPLLLTCCYIVLLRVVKLNAPGIYGILGAALCLLLLIGSFFTGNPLRIVLSILAYMAAGVVLIATAGGYLPGKLLSSVLFALPLICRFLFYSLGGLNIIQWFQEASALLILASLFCLTRSFTELKRRPAERKRA